MKYTTDILSVIIPCYNNGEYLAQLLDCFKKQTSDDWEIVIVDDGSTDDTLERIQKYSQLDNRIKVYQRDRQPKGSVVCRNIGFQKSTGEFISHIDADDLVSDTFVENRIKFLKEHPDVDYATFIAKTFIDGHPLPAITDPGKIYGKGVNTSDILSDFLSADYCFSVWCNVYRRSSIQNIIWDEKVKIYTDFSYIVPVLLKNLKHSFAEGNIDYYYRLFPKHSQSINMCSNFISDEKSKSTIYLFNKTLDSLSERADFDVRKTQFLHFITLHFIRLMKGRDINQIKRYIELIQKYYSLKISSTFTSISQLANKTCNQRWYEVQLYYKLYKFFGSKYSVNLIYAVGKWVLHK